MLFNQQTQRAIEQVTSEVIHELGIEEKHPADYADDTSLNRLRGEICEAINVKVVKRLPELGNDSPEQLRVCDTIYQEVRRINGDLLPTDGYVSARKRREIWRQSE